MTPLPITYYSDVLCIWAYVAQERLDELYREHGSDISVKQRFVSVFGDVPGKIDASWKDRDGYEGYARHVKSVADRFPHVRLSSDTWVHTRPTSSLSPHLFLKAIALWEQAQHAIEPKRLPITESITWAFRRGFFAEARDISERTVQQELARPFGVPANEVAGLLDTGVAHAALSADYQSAEKARIEGSPTFLINEGRQKLYGNVGFRIIEANIRELLREPSADQASWC